MGSSTQSGRLLPVVVAAFAALAVTGAAPAASHSGPARGAIARPDAAASAARAQAPDHVDLESKAVALASCPRHHHCKHRGPRDSGWKVSLSVKPSFQNDGTWQLFVRLTRTSGKASETHGYAFTLPAQDLQLASDLSTVQLDSGQVMGSFGRVKLKLTHAGALESAQPEVGCTGGTWQMRTGRLTGSLRLVADHRYFHTIMLGSFGATVSANTGGTPTCSSSTTICSHTESLSAQTTGGPIVYVSDSSQGVSLLEFVSLKAGAATIDHELSETGLPAGDLMLASDLSSGSATTTGAKHFTGSLSFTASGPATQGPYPACGAGATFSIAKGTSTGGIVAHFLAVPALAPAAGTSYASRS